MKNSISIIELPSQVDSKRQIAQLKNRCDMLESGGFSSIVNLRDEYEWFDKSTPDTDKTILIVGGFDGTSWLADLNSYCLSRDTMASLCPMPTQRSYASAVKLGGEIFVLGGFDGDVWYDTGIVCKLNLFVLMPIFIIDKTSKVMVLFMELCKIKYRYPWPV